MTNEINDGGPAFASPIDFRGDIVQHKGMSLRDWYAGMALQGLLSRDTIQADGNNDQTRWAVMNPLEAFHQRARQAYDYADAMLKVRGQ